MVKYTTNEQQEKSKHLETKAPPNQNENRVIAEYSDFHKELVKFTLYFSGSLFPILFAMDELSRHLQNAVIHILEPSPQHSQKVTVSDLWARVLISIIYLCMFSIYWFARNYIRSKKAIKAMISRNNDAGPPEIFENHSDNLAEEVTSDDQQVKKLSQQLEQQRFFIKKIQTQMYEDNVRPRYDALSFHATYTVGNDGDIEVQKHVTLESPEYEVHFWRFWANGGPYANPVENEFDLHLHVRALDDGKTEIVPLLVENKPTYKLFTVNFLPAITPGNRRAFSLKYEWRGFLSELATTGRTTYAWDMRSYTPNCCYDVSVEWYFDDCYGEISCESPGVNPAGMSLTKENRPRGTYLRYAGQGVPVQPFELTFICNTNK